MTDARPYRLHGLRLSYFTGKLEAYFQTKGIPFEFVEMDVAGFRRCARASGVAQMPQVETPDGRWLTDTTAIIKQFESSDLKPALRPPELVAAFVSLLLEDLFDEWLWRPALYYRWAFDEDARLMSAQIARTMLRDVPAPFWLRRRLILARQRRVYLHGEGVTRRTAPQVEAHYLQSLDALEPILRNRPYLLGARPCEADFGLFGPMFRHFSSDPTPAAIMRARAPHVALWVSRLWAVRPGEAAAAPEIDSVPEDLAPLLAMATREYLPYLAANAAAVAAQARTVAHAVDGVAWRTPPSAYRVHCLAELQAAFAALGGADRARTVSLLGDGAAILAAPTVNAPSPPPAGRNPADRHWSAARPA